MEQNILPIAPPSLPSEEMIDSEKMIDNSASPPQATPETVPAALSQLEEIASEVSIDLRED